MPERGRHAARVDDVCESETPKSAPALKFIRRPVPPPSVSSPESQVRLISAMPKSGTWSLHYFWAVFAALRAGVTECDPFAAFWRFSVFDIELFGIAHMFCPEFARNADPAELKAWRRLEPVAAGLDWGSEHIRRHAPNALPPHCRNWRMLFVYRNPLDQITSYYGQYRTYYDKPRHPYRIRDRWGRVVRFSDASDFCLKVGMSSYVKYFLTFERQKARFGDRIRWMTYERMVRDRAAAYREMVEFLSGPITACRKQPFRDALHLTSMESLGALESRLGIAISDAARMSQASQHQAIDSEPSDRVGRNHIFSGAIGRWKSALSAQAQDYCFEMLRKHGIPETCFDFR